MEQLQSYDIVKKCKGNLVLRMPAFDSSVQDKEVYIPQGVQMKRVGRVHALGIFTDATLEQMYREGYFTVEPAAAFEQDVASVFYAVGEKVTMPSDETIIGYLTKGNRKGVRTLIEEEGEAVRQQVIVLARENIDNIPTSMISDLEKLLGTVLIVEESGDDDED